MGPNVAICNFNAAAIEGAATLIEMVFAPSNRMTSAPSMKVWICSGLSRRSSMSAVTLVVVTKSVRCGAGSQPAASALVPTLGSRTREQVSRRVSTRQAGVPAPHSLWKGRQLRLGIRGHGGTRGVHDHGQVSVVSFQAGDFDHPRLAEFGERPRVGGVADALVAEQLYTKVVDHLFILRHARG